MMTIPLKMMCLRILMRHGALTQLIDLRFCKAAGTLIVPPGKLAHYWVSLCKTEFTGTILSMIG